MKILIIGSGGHAKVVADILIAMEGVEPVGFASRDDPPGSVGPLGLPILGNGDTIQDIEHDGVVVAIGDNRARKRVFGELSAAGENLFSAVHPSAVIASSATIGAGCMICAGAVINPSVSIGDNVICNTGCTVDHDCEVAAHCHVAPGVNVAGTVRVGEGVFLGIGSCVVQNVSIGPWTTIGAGAAVVGDIGPETVAVGVPARPMEQD